MFVGIFVSASKGGREFEIITMWMEEFQTQDSQVETQRPIYKILN